MEGANFEVIERGEIVFHARVEEESLAESKNHAREHARITGHDRTISLSVADRGFIVGQELSEDLLETVSQFRIGRRDLGAERMHGASEDTTVFGKKLFLLEAELVETSEDAAERRGFGRKHGLEVEPVLGPTMSIAARARDDFDSKKW